MTATTVLPGPEEASQLLPSKIKKKPPPPEREAVRAISKDDI
jgi:hypothetical protein